MRLPGFLMDRIWPLLRDPVIGFFYDEALTRGASIAFYTVFAFAPILLIATAVAGLVFGMDAARGAVVRELSGLMGSSSAEAIQQFLQSAQYYGNTVTATSVGVITLCFTATGVFVELQTALNVIWRAPPAESLTMSIVRGRLLSLGLLGSLGFLLLVSLLVSAALSALSDYVSARWHAIVPMLAVADGVITFVLITVLIAAIYKVLPDRDIDWADVGVGAVVTSLLFAAGKYGISLYIGHSSIASAYGSAGSLLVFLLWIYYSAQIFLLGAEFTRVYAERRRGGKKPPVQRT